MAPIKTYQVANNLLNNTIAKVDKIVEKATANTPNITVQADGWSDVNPKSLASIALYAGRPIFHSSVDPGAQRHNAKFFANTIMNVVLNERSASAVDKHMYHSLVTDQPLVMRAAWEIISNKASWNQHLR